MTETLYFILPGDPATLTGGYRYNAEIAARLDSAGFAVRWRRLSARFPFPDGADRRHAEATFAALPDRALTVVDGLAAGVLDDTLRRHGPRLRLLVLVHHPQAAETGLDRLTRAALRRSERAALTAARRVVTTSPRTAAALCGADYRVPRDRVGVVEPGTDPAPCRRASRSPPHRLLCVATLTPRKGHALLLRALQPLRRRRWQLRCIGSATRDRFCALRLYRLRDRLGLRARVRFDGEMPQTRLRRAYRAADALVLASYYEGYGMAFTEALARGLPVVACAGGATAETVPADAGLLCRPGDRAALTAALRQLLSRPARYRRLAAGARRARRRLQDWDAAARRFAAELGRLC